MDQHLIFVVGAPRSGTTWLHRMIAEHPDVASIPNELTVFSNYLSVWFRNYEREKKNLDEGRWEQGMPLVMEREELANHARKLIQSVYDKVLQHNRSATHILDKHPNYANSMGLIKELCPQARFVHIIRDGRQVALSMMSVNKRVGHSAGDIRQAARDWHRFVSNARRSADGLGKDYLELRYEDLVDNRKELLKTILSFCNLNVDDELIEHIQEKFDPSKGKLSSGDPNSGISISNWEKRMPLKQRYIFQIMAGKLLVELGYAKKNWWVQRASDKINMGLARPILKARRASKAFIKELKKPLETDLDNE